MRRSPSRLALTLVISLACISCSAESVSLGPAGDAEITYDSSKGLAGLEVTIDKVRFRPLAGAAALGPDGKPDTSIELHLRAAVVEDAVQLTITSSDSRARGLDPGVVDGLGEWRRLDLSRYADHYGQVWWQKTTYSVNGDFWFTAHWVIEESDGTRWKSPNNANHGTGPFPAALRVEYEPDTDGAYLPIHEVLELRFAKRLWDVVPMPRQKPSQYRELLAESVFADCWGSNPVLQLQHFLKVIKSISRGKPHYYTILQNWEAAGWDALLPDSIWLPDYPPNPGVGTVKELRGLCELGKSMGRFGFRTNYRILRSWSPSFRKGIAHYAVDAQGRTLDYLRPADWLPVAKRQENEIRELFAPNAGFTDQMTSGAAPWLWHDFAAHGGSRSMRQTLDHQKRLARLIKETHKGPLSSESLSDQHLFGQWVDTGDFGIANGHQRFFSPEYKLRRLHHLSAFHGMGLMYRFYEMPPYKRFRSGTTTFKNDPVQLDDYRAAEILFGNGAYVCYDFANWQYYLTECLLVGNLQKYYCAQPVRDVRYWHRGAWTTLDDYVRAGNLPNIIPWHKQTEAYGRIRVEYQNGLTVVANRLPEEFTVADAGEDGVVLPRSGWVAWKKDNSLLAFSAYWPRTRHRVDSLRDDKAGIRYLDPRGRKILGVSTITLWEKGDVILSANPDNNTITVCQEELKLDLPAPEPRTTLNFDFDDGLEGWRPIRGILSANARRGTLCLKVVSPAAYLYSPPLSLNGDKVAAIQIRMKVQASQAKPAGLYFTTENFTNFWNDKLVNFDLTPDGQFHTYHLKVGQHPKWAGQKITRLRLDPVRGATEAEVEIDSICGMEP